MARHAETRRPLDQFVERAGRLYTLPAVAVEVLRLTQEPKVDVQALTQCIERDPALVGKILRTVNSSLFGLSREVTDLQQAVALLGIKPLNLLVLGFSLPPKLLSGSEQEALARYWQHALVKAVAARELATRSGDADGDDAFLAGLLQDIGVLVLLKDLGEPYARFIERAHVEELDLLSLELDTLGFDHRLLSARLLTSWGLPESFCKMIAISADSPSVARMAQAFRPIPPILAQAESLALVTVAGRSDALATLAQSDSQADPAAWLAFIDGLREKVDDLARVFDLSLPQGAAHDEILARAHELLASESDLAAADFYRQGQASKWQETESLVAAAEQFQNITAAPNHKATPKATAACAASDSAAAMSESVVAKSNAAVAVSAVDDPGLAGLAARGVAECRRHRLPLSLMLIEFDEFEDLAFRLGMERANAHVRKFAASATALVLDAHSTELGEGQLALLLYGSDRQQTVVVARRLMQLASEGRWLSPRDPSPVTLSIGVASVGMPAKNFPACDLIAAAQRCLFGASAGGGNSVKSIDIY